MDENSNIVQLREPDDVDDPLTEVLLAGARQLLAQAVELEVEAFLAERADVRLSDSRVRLVRHGHGPEREVQTGIGAVAVSRPKVRDRGAGEGSERIRFTSAICRDGLGERAASTPCCRRCTCAASRRATFRSALGVAG